MTAVERGYNVFEANCSRCHGVNGEGGIGPVLNRQDKLFAHLNENYLRTVLTAGGRYVCGDPNSLMPVWSNEANPPGPLNYRQIDELVAFLRATNDKDYIVRDPELGTPKIDPVDRQGAGRSPAGATRTTSPIPARRRTRRAGRTSSRPPPPPRPGSAARLGRPVGPRPAPRPRPSGGGRGASVTITASGIAFTTPAVTRPRRDRLHPRVRQPGRGASRTTSRSRTAPGAQVFKTDIFPGVEKRTFQVPALAAGTYPFACTVHANMTGTLTAQ